MPKIAISYRRSDSSAITGRIADRLTARYGRESIFIDVDSVPVGTDFRRYIAEVWSEISVLIVVVGPGWLGAAQGSDAGARIHERMDVVRLELELALERDVAIVPILVDGAAMPTREQLPRSLRAFSDRNAGEVAAGRDFHPHVDRLIQAIDRLTGEQENQPRSEQTSAHGQPVDERIRVGPAASAFDGQPLTTWSARLLRDIAFPVFILLVLHHLIVNVYDLDTIYLRIVSFAVPFLLGMLIFWHARWEPAAAFAIAASVGLISVAAMTVSQGVNSGRPIVPSTTFEWRESVEFVVSIAFSFGVGYLLARTLSTWPWKKRG